MTQKTVAKLAGAVALAAMFAGAGLAFAQTPTYDKGQAGSMSAGSIVPSGNNMSTTGITDPGTGGTVRATGSTAGTSGTTGTTPGIPNTGTSGTRGASSTPGIPNTGAGGDAAATMLALGASALIAAGAATYLVRQRYAR